MRILAIETSGATFSLALAENNRIILEKFWKSALKHSEKLIPALKQLLKKAKWKISSIDKIAVSTGPGSFTGIRVGLSCAKTMAQVLDIPIVGIDTIEILRASMPEKGHNVIGVIDALRNEVFVKNKNGKIVLKNNEDYWKELKSLNSKFCILGNASITYKNEINNILKKYAIINSSDFNYPKAGVLALMAEKLNGKNYRLIEPLYIRRSWAEEKK
ncbi:MAG: tRNA (adenosine(37)-N6)-threonylcarbamoyltransferase complex dimerization subunit type 1 TsaB [Elusimicrobia bacterium]|nr:tRNA (adenosine(37)-N6)-threonylcarbamoyltransferase complex dimerization subunit type 1 TsaB [Elusimicrobiota bacterium]